MISLKADLQRAMAHLLDLLREILASIHEERIVVGREEIQSLKDILDRRGVLLEVYAHSYKGFVHILCAMRKISVSNYSLMEHLEWLHAYLDAEDCELLLLSEQLVGIEQELEVETKSLLNFQQYRTAISQSFNSFLVKESPKLARITVGVVENEEDI